MNITISQVYTNTYIKKPESITLTLIDIDLGKVHLKTKKIKRKEDSKSIDERERVSFATQSICFFVFKHNFWA